MALLPVLPPIDGETLISYLNRAAWFHTGQPVRSFLSMLEMPQTALLSVKDMTLMRIADITGLSDEALRQMTFLSLGSRMRTVRGEVVHAEFANFDLIRFCPSCLLEDGRSEGPTAGFRIGRLAWHIEHVRVCPQHGTALHVRKVAGFYQRFQLMSEVAPADAELEKLVAEAKPEKVSALQTYVLDRLAGKPGPQWLDDQPIDLAARACEMLGIILVAGTHVNLNKLTLSDWNKAGDVGFGFAARGAHGIREALDEGYNRAVKAGLKGGPQHIFGRLYQWLQFNKNEKSKGPVSDVVRDYVLDNFPIAKGTQLMGQVVDCQRVHSIHSLAKVSGEHPKTVNRAVILAGLAKGDPNKASVRTVFDAEAGVALFDRIRDSIPTNHLPKYLNCNRTQAETLVRSGVIPRLFDIPESQASFLRNVARKDADAFLDSLFRAVTIKTAPHDGMLEIVAAAEASRWPVLDIIKAILDGHLTRVGCLDRDLRFKGIVVDPEEIKVVLAQLGDQGMLSVDEAAKRLRISPSKLEFLAKQTDKGGAPYLASVTFTNAKGVQKRSIPVANLDAFLDRHVSLTDLAVELGLPVKTLGADLAARGINPIAPNRLVGRYYFRRSDLAA